MLPVLLRQTLIPLLLPGKFIGNDSLDLSPEDVIISENPQIPRVWVCIFRLCVEIWEKPPKFLRLGVLGDADSGAELHASPGSMPHRLPRSEDHQRCP